MKHTAYVFLCFLALCCVLSCRTRKLTYKEEIKAQTESIGVRLDSFIQESRKKVTATDDVEVVIDLEKLEYDTTNYPGDSQGILPLKSKTKARVTIVKAGKVVKEEQANTTQVKKDSVKNDTNIEYNKEVEKESKSWKVWLYFALGGIMAGLIFAFYARKLIKHFVK